MENIVENSLFAGKFAGGNENKAIVTSTAGNSLDNRKVCYYGGSKGGGPGKDCNGGASGEHDIGYGGGSGRGYGGACREHSTGYGGGDRSGGEGGVGYDTVGRAYGGGYRSDGWWRWWSIGQ
nr:glycine-rich cell wall structural protein 1.8-like [Arachis hypogaea]